MLHAQEPVAFAKPQVVCVCVPCVAMVSFHCFQQQLEHQVRVRFTWFSEDKEEVPLVAIPDQDLTPQHIMVPWCVGRVVQLTLPSGKQNNFLIAFVYWNDYASPLVLLSRVRSPSMYSVSMVVPGFSAGNTLDGCRKWYYHQVKGIPRIGEEVPGDRRFTPDTQKDFDFPAPMQPPAQPAAASSRMSGAERKLCNRRLAAVFEPSPEEATAIAIEEGSDALEAANYGVMLAASTAEAEAAELLARTL